ncbi:MAG TPA: NADPH:quinone reductase [Actinomycetes bacterium]|nr:NADPH:quinone reductase [Actinomycetes bacterium]
MRAVVYESLGASDVLRLVDIALPEPGPGEVRVRVHVSAVNPTDWKQRSGSTMATMPFPRIVPNQDGAGVIDAVGSGIDASRVGERVWMQGAVGPHGLGTAQEFVCLPERNVVPLPESASFDLGASLGVPAVTAALALFADGRLTGKTVLVAGGAGAVGHFAIELAKRDGARVVTTVSSPGKAELAVAAGADAVINYREANAVTEIREAAPDGVDRVVEVNLPANLSLDLDVVRTGGTIVTYAAGAEEPQVPTRRLMTANLSLDFLLLYTVADEVHRAAVREVSAALADGALTELPARRFSLADTAAAHDAVEGGAVGKVLIDVGSD